MPALVSSASASDSQSTVRASAQTHQTAALPNDRVRPLPSAPARRWWASTTGAASACIPFALPVLHADVPGWHRVPACEPV